MDARLERQRRSRVETHHHLKDKLRIARQRCKLTQEDVAERVGVDPEVYGKLERGGFVPRVWLLVKLSILLRVSVNHLLGLDEPAAEPPHPVPPTEPLPTGARRVLRVVRQLRPDQIELFSLTASALLKAKEKRRKSRGRVSEKG